MNPLCKYRDSLGRPGLGIHRHRLFGVAIVDVIMTLIGAAIIASFTGWKFSYTLVGLFIVGIVAHRAFCVRTQVDRWLFK